jgi:CheY-like chemotaxis protein
MIVFPLEITKERRGVKMEKRILLVDDESAIRRTLSLMLLQLGYDVEPCENGINALKKLDLYEKNKIKLDSIVLDIRLPDIDGIKLGKIIRSKYPQLSLVFITGYSDQLNLSEVKKVHANAILEKPINANDLVGYFEETSLVEEVPELDETTIVEKDVQTVSAYMLIKLDKEASFLDTYRKLYYSKDVLYCDATTGDYDIMLLIQSSSREECRKVNEKIMKDVEGIKNIDFLEIGTPVLDDYIKDIIKTTEDALFSEPSKFESTRDFSKRLCSYVLLEVEREKLEHIYPVLRLSENVIYCDYTTGKYNLVLYVFGTGFNEIDKFIEEKVIALDGVLRVKKFPVVNLFEM